MSERKYPIVSTAARCLAATMTFAGAFAPAVCLAAGVPNSVLNKTVKLSFQVSGTSRTVGEVAEHSYNTSVSWIIYVSDKGRLFTRALQTSGGRDRSSRGADIEPNSGNIRFQFRGNNLVGVVPWMNGARQMTLSFDSNFSNCTASTIDGRSGGSIRRQAPNGKMVDVLSSNVSSLSCSVQSGNAFAN